MTSSSTVPGRRYRLRDDTIPVEHKQVYRHVADLEGDRVVIVRIEDPDDRYKLIASRHWLEPVGLDMAEPDDGMVVHVSWVDRGMRIECVFQRLDDRAEAFGDDRRWVPIFGDRYTWAEFCTMPGVSITVLVPRENAIERDAQLLVARHGLERLRHWAEVCERDLVDRAVASAHAWYRDETAKVIAALDAGDVLVPRDDDLRERVAAALATAAEKATNLTERTPIGAVHAYYRDVFADLLAESGWSINGRRPQADDGE